MRREKQSQRIRVFDVLSHSVHHKRTSKNLGRYGWESVKDSEVRNWEPLHLAQNQVVSGIESTKSPEEFAPMPTAVTTKTFSNFVVAFSLIWIADQVCYDETAPIRKYPLRLSNSTMMSSFGLTSSSAMSVY